MLPGRLLELLSVCRVAGRLSECDSDMMGFAVIRQHDVRRSEREHLVIKFQAGNAAANAGMIVNEHLVSACVVAKRDFEISPRPGHAGVDPQCVALHVEPQNRL
jgi:hypothetical protein